MERRWFTRHVESDVDRLETRTDWRQLPGDGFVQRSVSKRQKTFAMEVTGMRRIRLPNIWLFFFFYLLTESHDKPIGISPKKEAAAANWHACNYYLM